MATLDDLRAAVLPGARWLAAGPDVAPSTATSLDLAWVRLMRARVPAFDALEAGDLAIVSRAALAVVAPDAESVGALVRGCIDARIGGIVLVADPASTSEIGPGVSTSAASGRPDATLDELVATASLAGLPVVDAGPADAAAVERSAIGFLVNHRAELERQATILETRLEQVALAGGGPEGMAAAIAGFLGRAIAIEGRRGTTLAMHVPPDIPDAAAAVAAYHDRRRAAAGRIALPMPGEMPANSGALALLGERPPTELERVATGRIAGLVALELARDEALGRALETARREPLPADGPPWVVIVARQAHGPAAGSEARISGALDGPGPEAGDGDPDDEPRESARREALRRDLRSLAPARRLALRGDALSVELRIVAALDGADPDGVAIGGRIGAFLGRLVAVSRPFSDPAGRSAAEADARATLEAAEGLASPPPIARADRLPAYRMLGNLHNLPDGTRQARALLAPLLRGRPDVRRERLETLRAVLDQHGLAEAAEALGVHRNTIAYRVRRIEEATGWQLADPELRFPLALALRLVQDE
jgi:PucR family transcriptional regulator, purine catabolism regulatory protein